MNPSSNLQVKKSSLPGAGKGLFTRLAVRKGALIVEYTGLITTWKKIKDDERFNGYVFYVSANHVIDAWPVLKALARYANDARGISRVEGLSNNAVYAVRNKKVYIKASRPIKAGEEIFVDYGREYWQAVRYNLRLGLMK